MSDNNDKSASQGYLTQRTIAATLGGTSFIAIIEIVGWGKLDWVSTVALWLFTTALPCNVFMYTLHREGHSPEIDIDKIYKSWLYDLLAGICLFTPVIGLSLLLFQKSRVASILFAATTLLMTGIAMRVPRKRPDV